MTRQNASHARCAAEAMAKVDATVTSTNHTLAEMLASMEQINTSSDKISRIIKVIEEIAFQTNILALNAAVEAARAGDAGMGFAVVADEVRTLAQRSSHAARDTTALIEESVASSRQGNLKVLEVADAIRAITAEASTVKRLVDEMDEASQEQARGIEQISGSLAQMEVISQTLAATSEESASTGQQMSAQAKVLMKVVTGLQALVDGGRA